MAATPSDKPIDPQPDPTAEFRWQTFFQNSPEPIFVLNARRRLLFANRAWEACTGLKFAEVHQRRCRRVPEQAEVDPETALLALHVPPLAARQGAMAQTRRRVPIPKFHGNWWEFHFFPLMGKKGVLGFLGRIQPLLVESQDLFTLPEKLVVLQSHQAAQYRIDALGASTAALRLLSEQARLAAQVRHPILIQGEAGVGKEWLARCIHQASPLRQRLFARFNADRLPADYLAELILGPRRSRGDLGLIYLVEPAALPRELQSRLVSILAQEDQDEPRWIFGQRTLMSSKPVPMIEDLDCQMRMLTLTIPPLRDRLGDLPRFLELFQARLGQALGQVQKPCSAEAFQILQMTPWPENLRELYLVLMSAQRHAAGACIEPEDLPFYLRHDRLAAERKFPLDALLEQAERRLIELALKLTRDNRSKAAELLEIWQTRLVRRMKHFGMISPQEVPKQEEE